MGHATIDNDTPFAVTPAAATDEDGRPLLVVLVRATYVIAPGVSLELARVQPPADLVGQRWEGDDASSYRVEPAYAFTKSATDVVLVGHAQAPGRAVAESTVVFRVGTLGKSVRIVGDRVWTRTPSGVAPSRPAPFERIPLAYERAFGGWDRSSADPARHACEPRNPVGRGFRAPSSPFEEGVTLPNLEDPTAPLERWGQVVPPCGVGFIAPDWHPRAAYAGTYDRAWREARMPALPRDFDRRFFNAASPGLIATGYLRGDEPVLVEGAGDARRLAFQLPGPLALACRVELAGAPDVAISPLLDTIVVDTDNSTLTLLLRASTRLRDGLHDVRTIAVRAQGGGARPKEASKWASP